MLKKPSDGAIVIQTFSTSLLQAETIFVTLSKSVLIGGNLLLEQQALCIKICHISGRDVN